MNLPGIGMFNQRETCIENLRCDNMCTIGGPMDMEIPGDRVQSKDCKCGDCGNRFKGIGKKPICPSCQSDNIIY